MVIRGGVLEHIENRTQYNELAEELARRTYDQSGDFYVSPFRITARESLDDKKGNNGIFTKDQLTYNSNIPSDDLATYKISPGKAFVRGFESEKLNCTLS